LNFLGGILPGKDIRLFFSRALSRYFHESGIKTLADGSEIGLAIEPQLIGS
jgi:hypothetical protein